MARLTLALTLLIPWMAKDVSAQNASTTSHLEFPARPAARTDIGIERAKGALAYRQLLVQEDSRAAAIRRRAEFRSQQRALRLAAQKWYGVSSSRPAVSTTLWSGLQRPAWNARPPQRFAWYQQPAATAGASDIPGTRARR